MINIPNIEKDVLSFWNEKDIFEKSLKKDSPKGPASAKATAGKDYVFYDGPPFATGTPHYGHIVASLMKDMVPRYWTMQGFRVERKWGWDCHGLPIENIVEEEMQTKSKKDIEDMGVDKFNETCRSKVMMYADEWKKVINRLGRWVDMENDYKTMDKDFMESVWWVFKQLWDKDLIYEGYKSMHVCPRCETTLSQSEVTEGYKDVEDISVTAEFELVDEPGTFVLAWTTTPWTLPGNVALAVGEDVDYVVIEHDSGPENMEAKEAGGGKKVTDNLKAFSNFEKYIVAKELLEKVMGEKHYEIIKELKGKDLVGKKYKPLFPYYENVELENKENLYTIVTADFVTTEDGTGVVHIAPAFGEDDMNLGNEKDLPFIQHVSMDGRLKDEVKDFAGLEVKPKDDPISTDKKVLAYLNQKNLVFSETPFTHSYPYCWRCHSPLLNYATSSLFVNVTKIKPQLLENAKNINWTPAHIKDGRFGRWLEGARDWSISRQRFWGSVIPIWKCDKCDEKKVMGSVEELEKLSGDKVEDLHKHFVDKITFKCEKCDGEMCRVPDVLDCWFESGSMPYAQSHYPFDNKEKFENNFPAEFIAEGADQTRAWFYYMHILSTILKGSNAYKNVVVNGIVLAEDGKKMSKHLKNYPDPMEIMDKYGADAMRYYLATSQVMKADDLCFTEKGVDEVYKKVLLTLYNVLSFYQMFIQDLKVGEFSENDLTNILDKWIIARGEYLLQETTTAYNGYDLVRASRPVEGFINDLSTWYVRRSRDRFKSDNEQEKMQALKTLRHALLNLAKVIAPVMPFTADHVYRELNGQLESVHLEDWPEVRQESLDQKVLDYMDITRKVVELALAERADKGIKVRQPLQKLEIKNQKLGDEYLDLIKDEVNVKQVECVAGDGDLSVELDLELTDELKQEGLLRELVRTINNLRKKTGLTINDRIEIKCNTKDQTLKTVFEKFGDELQKQTLANKLSLVDEELEEVKLNEYKIGLGIEVIK